MFPLAVGLFSQLMGWVGSGHTKWTHGQLWPIICWLYCQLLRATLQWEQICVEPPPSALDMTLPAFAAERRLQAHQLSTDAALSSKPASRCCQSMRQTDWRTDGRTPERCRDPALHTMLAAPVKWNMLMNDNSSVYTFQWENSAGILWNQSAYMLSRQFNKFNKLKTS